MIVLKAEIEREYGPFEGIHQIGGVSFDGRQIWFASGKAIVALDPTNGEVARQVPVPGQAGTAFDGRFLYQIVDRTIQKVDPETGSVLATIPAPGNGQDSGLAWAEGSLWVGQYRDRKIHRIDPETGKILRTIESNRFVTGVTWVDGELWHGSSEAGENALRRIDPETGEVLVSLELPEGTSGLESDGRERFYAGTGTTGKVLAIKRPRRAKTG
jgi:streptogramin lyase